MKNFTKFTLTATLVFALAACDKSENTPPTKAETTVQTQAEVKPAHENTIAQTTQTANSAPQEFTGKYAEALNNYPSVDPKLIEPITISAEKSKTGAKDFETYINYMSEAEQELRAPSIALQQKVQIALKQDAKQMLSDDISKDLTDYSVKVEKYQKGLESLNVQDEEVKQLVNQSILAAKVSSDGLIASVKNISLLKGLTNKDAESAKFLTAYMTKANELKKAMSTYQNNTQDAINKLTAKYFGK